MLANTKFQTILGCKYPIVAMAMNQVSDINLAKAVRRAGGIPSLSLFNYPNSSAILINQDFNEYKNTFGDTKIFVSLGVSDLITPAILDLICDYKIEFIELILDTYDEFKIDTDKDKKRDAAIQRLKDNGIKIFMKCIAPAGITPDTTGIILKGVEGAGRGMIKTKDFFDKVRKEYPNIDIIVSGGVGNADQVKYYLDNGALAIGVGTLFALAEESTISLETKNKLIEYSASDIKRFNTGAKQNSIVFKEVDDSDFNHTKGLKLAIKSPEAGHVFIGTGIEDVTAVKTVATIINELVAKLDL